MHRFQALKIAAAVLATALPMTAQAAVTYQFTFTEASTSRGSFSVTVADPITANTVIPFASLTSCSVGNPVVSCGDQAFAYQPARTSIGFGTTQEFEGDVFHVTSFAYFSLDAFITNGVHDDIVWPGEATLTVSGIPEGWSPPAQAVPEPASWALMIGGLGLAGATLRRRRPAVRFAAI